MQILKRLEKYCDETLAFSWNAEEDAFYREFLPVGESLILRVDNDQEEIAPEVFQNRSIVSRLLMRRFQPGEEVVISNCDLDSGTEDGCLYFYMEQHQAQLDCLEESSFNQLLYDLDLESIPPDVLKMIFYLLQENKNLVAEGLELRKQIDELKKEVHEEKALRALHSEPRHRFLFPSNRYFQNWVLERFEDIERNATLLHQNYPRRGMSGQVKNQVDFLFQDVNQQYLLVDVMYRDRRVKKDPIVHLVALQEAREYLSRAMSVPLQNIRLMVITNEGEEGVCDLCTINQVEVITVTGNYLVERRC